jgi:integrase
MRGHAYKRGSTWTVMYDEQPADDGKRRQRSKGGFATKREAEQWLTDTLAKMATGSYASPSKVALGDFLQHEWLPTVTSTVRPLTAATYESAVRVHIKPRIGSMRLQAVSGGTLNGLYAQLEQAGLGAGTIRLVHAVISRAFRDAERWGRVPRNVARLADPPRANTARVTVWTAGELRRFLEHVRDDRLAALWRLASTTGMRRGELAGLTWQTLDLDGARLSVEQQLVPTKGGASFGAPKSRRSRRTIALDPETVDMLRRHRDTQLLERDFAGPAYTDRDLVFADPLGGTIHPRRLSAWFSKHRTAAGIPTGSLHVLRHTAATLMLTGGVPIHIAAARLGDDPTTVLDTYAHLLPPSDELAAEQVAAALA